MNPKLVASALASLLLPLCLTVAAHEKEAHGKNKDAAIVKEQKPWGIAELPKLANRTISVTMSDNMRFTPDRFEIKRGEVVRFAIKNEGKMLHEMVIGSKKELDEHAALMVKFPNMEHHEPYMAHVAPGETGDITWRFNRTGDFEFACLIAGHYQAGMKGTITVVSK